MALAPGQLQQHLCPESPGPASDPAPGPAAQTQHHQTQKHYSQDAPQTQNN